LPLIHTFTDNSTFIHPSSCRGSKWSK